VVQRGSPTPVPIVTNNVRGQPGTKVLLGGNDLDTNPNPGFRLTAGYALNERWGLEGNFLSSLVTPLATVADGVSLTPCTRRDP
jgi:hypothetical protein